jgi:hypothetical protein
MITPEQKEALQKELPHRYAKIIEGKLIDNDIIKSV